MARMRMVKAEFWTSEQVVECSPMARLLFIGLLNFCDDRGVHPASCRRLKMEIFPADAVEVKPLIDELIASELVAAFEVEGVSYWHVTGFFKHQRVTHPSWKYPAPPGWSFNEGSGSANGAVLEDSDRRVAERSVAERRVEGKSNTSASEGSPAAIDFTDVDWEAARGLANEAVKALDLVGLKRHDRRLLLVGAAVEQRIERLFSDAYRATASRYRSSNPPGKGKCAYLHGALIGKLKDLGRDFVAISDAIKVPDVLLNGRRDRDEPREDTS